MFTNTQNATGETNASKHPFSSTFCSQFSFGFPKTRRNVVRRRHTRSGAAITVENDVKFGRNEKIYSLRTPERTSARTSWSNSVEGARPTERRGKTNTYLHNTFGSTTHGVVPHSKFCAAHVWNKVFEGLWELLRDARFCRALIGVNTSRKPGIAVAVRNFIKSLWRHSRPSARRPRRDRVKRFHFCSARAFRPWVLAG